MVKSLLRHYILCIQCILFAKLCAGRVTRSNAPSSSTQFTMKWKICCCEAVCVTILFHPHMLVNKKKVSFFHLLIYINEKYGFLSTKMQMTWVSDFFKMLEIYSQILLVRIYHHVVEASARRVMWQMLHLG